MNKGWKYLNVGYCMISEDYAKDDYMDYYYYREEET